VDVLVHREEFSPGRVVVGALELNVISEQILVLNILQEPLDLPQQSNVFSLEAEANVASTVNHFTFLRVSHKNVIERNVVVDESTKHGSRSKVFLLLTNRELFVGVDSGERRQLADSSTTARLVFDVLADLIANKDVALAGRHQSRNAVSVDLVGAATGERASDVCFGRDG